MPEIVNKEVVARQLRAAIRGMSDQSGAKVVQVQYEVAEKLGISARTLQSWISPTSVPGKIQDELFLGLAWLALSEGERELNWFVKLLQATTLLVPEPFTTRWLQEYLMRARVCGVSLSQAQIEHKVQQLFDREKRELLENNPAPSLALENLALCCEDWDEAINTSNFYGRDKELAQLQNWLVAEGSQVVAIVGTSGIGKSTLSARLVEKIKTNYKFIVRRSLRNAPPLEDMLDEWLEFFSEQKIGEIPSGHSEKIAELLRCFKKAHCLLVLDNFETVLRTGDYQGRYRAGYAGYGELIARLGQTEHASSLLLIAQERPPELEQRQVEGSHNRHTLHLAGLDFQACDNILQNEPLVGHETSRKALVDYYRGNPLALKLVAETIKNFYGANIATFLADGPTIFGRIEALLNQQFNCLSEVEQELLYWLAIEREPLSLTDLRANLAFPLEKHKLLEAIEVLQVRSLVEGGLNGPSFTLPPLILDYVTQHLVERISREILESRPDLLVSHALLKATARGFVRNIQAELILQPVLNGLLRFSRSQETVINYLKVLLEKIRSQPISEQGYAISNLVSLIYQLKSEQPDDNFSRPAFQQADRGKITSPGVALPAAKLSHLNFPEGFSSNMRRRLIQKGHLKQA